MNLKICATFYQGKIYSQLVEKYNFVTCLYFSVDAVGLQKPFTHIFYRMQLW